MKSVERGILEDARHRMRCGEKRKWKRLLREKEWIMRR
jgi:hypothetical protein